MRRLALLAAILLAPAVAGAADPWAVPAPSCKALGLSTNDFRARTLLDDQGCMLLGRTAAPARPVNQGSVVFGRDACPGAARRVYAGSVYAFGPAGTTDWNCWASPPSGGTALGPCVVCY
jgi:hypothetical protein